MILLKDDIPRPLPTEQVEKLLQIGHALSKPARGLLHTTHSLCIHVGLGKNYIPGPICSNAG